MLITLLLFIVGNPNKLHYLRLFIYFLIRLYNTYFRRKLLTESPIKGLNIFVHALTLYSCMPTRVSNFKAEEIVDAMYIMHFNITKIWHATRCQLDLSKANMNKYAYIKVKSRLDMVVLMVYLS